MKRIVDAGTAASDGEAMTAAAAEFGYTISVADLERATAEAQELDDDELEEVAGGIRSRNEDSPRFLGADEYGHDERCLVTWHCFATMLHTETNDHGAACWSDYLCGLVYNDPSVEF